MVPILPNGSTKSGGYHSVNHCDAGNSLVAECVITLYLKTASNIYNFHNFGGILGCAIAHRAVFIIVSFTRSANPFICGWWWIVVD